MTSRPWWKSIISPLGLGGRVSRAKARRQELALSEAILKIGLAHRHAAFEYAMPLYYTDLKTLLERLGSDLDLPESEVSRVIQLVEARPLFEGVGREGPPVLESREGQTYPSASSPIAPRR